MVDEQDMQCVIQGLVLGWHRVLLLGWVCGLGKRGLLVAKVKFPLPESALSGTWREYGEIQEAFFIRPSSKDGMMQS